MIPTWAAGVLTRWPKPCSITQEGQDSYTEDFVLPKIVYILLERSEFPKVSVVTTLHPGRTSLAAPRSFSRCVSVSARVSRLSARVSRLSARLSALPNLSSSLYAGLAALTGDRASGPRELALRDRSLRGPGILRRALRGRKVDELSVRGAAVGFCGVVCWH